MAYWWEAYPWTNLHDLNLDWVIEVCQKALDQVNGFPAEVEKLQKQITENKNNIVGLQNAVKALQSIKWEWSPEIAQSLEEAKEYTRLVAKAIHDDVLHHVSELHELIELEGQYSNNYTDIAIDNLKMYLEDIPLPAVVNPLNGKLESISDVLEDLFNLQKIKSLTAEQYDKLKLTAAEYDAQNLTAYDYDFFAGQYLIPGQEYGQVRNPFTGEWDTVQSVLDTLAAFHKDGNTAAEYDALDWTAEFFDSLGYTAYEYDNVPTT